jgi:hypothetical protein
LYFSFWTADLNALHEKFQHGFTFLYCYELQLGHRLKVSPTRIPPPICASAPGFQFAPDLKTVGAAND